jgi:hypothetical protein
MIGVIMLLWPVVDAGQKEFAEERTNKKGRKKKRKRLSCTIHGEERH